MKFGVVYPQTDFGSDPAAVRDYAQAVEEMGFTHIIAYDHVLGVNPDRPGGWNGPYTYQSTFLEPFVLFSYMASVTQKMGFMTGILILPQRQTVLVAKQAATLDIFCAGRFRLGVGLGWNEAEYVALNEDFHTRGKRMEEQIEVLRLLWTQPLVNFKGRWHEIPDAGIKPLPVQKPIPIWIGGSSEPALHRVARIGDGWLPNTRSVEAAQRETDVVHRTLEAIRRDPDSLGIEPRLAYGDGNPDAWQKMIRFWQSAGAKQFSIGTLRSGFKTPQEHIDALRKFVQEVEITPG